MIAALCAFTVAAAILTVAPGLDTALVLRTAVAGGVRNAMAAGAGIALGCCTWGVIVALGLGALLAASQTAYDVLRWIGAAYLTILGIRLIVKRHTVAEANAFEPPAPTDAAVWPHVARGFATNVLNPKVGVFYVSFLPQFVPAHANAPMLMLAMTAIHAVLGVCWFALLCAATAPLSTFLRAPAFRRWSDRITGGIFVAFGARLALERR